MNGFLSNRIDSIHDICIPDRIYGNSETEFHDKADISATNGKGN